VARPSRKNDQRTRILQAMTDTVAKEGYAQASISKTISLARVSRSTFYEHFEDKLDCFVALQQELSASLLTEIERAARGHKAPDIPYTIIKTLVGLVEREPVRARVLLAESFAAGPRAMDERDDLISRIESLVTDAWNELPAETPVIDISARALIGGVCRLLSIRILRGASGTHGLLPDLLEWVNSYTRVSGEPRWRTLSYRNEMPVPRASEAELRSFIPPAPLPAGRHSLPTAYVSANQRERILQATIKMLIDKGYASTTVADIASEARVTRAAFYQHFRDKQEVIVEINQIHFQRLMAVTARAFFSEERWPERVWEAVSVAAAMNAVNPAATKIGFIDTSAMGPEFARRVNEIVMAFAVFLEEGYRFRPDAEILPRLCSEAIAASMCELIYGEIRTGDPQRFRELVPHVAYVTLAPFMGPEHADEFIENKLHQSGTSA
jgi:AcrR family transcriptional regulator